MISLAHYLGGLFLGWSLGTNDSANVFGTAVSSRMVGYRTAVVLAALFVVLGAILQGEAGIHTLSQDLRRDTGVDPDLLSESALRQQRERARTRAIVVSYAAAGTVTLMSLVKMPVSASQAVVGAIVGADLLRGQVDYGGLGKVVACWLGTPVGGIFFTFLFYYAFRSWFRRWSPSLFVYDPTITVLLIVCGCYGAYALGANNVASVSAVFVGDGMLTTRQAAAYGGLAIAFGILTYSKPVMMTIGTGIVPLDSFTAFVVVLAHAVTVHIYALIGVPVSTSQAVVGSLVGIGIIKGAHTINYQRLGGVVMAWMAAPLIAAFMAWTALFVLRMLRG